MSRRRRDTTTIMVPATHAAKIALLAELPKSILALLIQHFEMAEAYVVEHPEVTLKDSWNLLLPESERLALKAREESPEAVAWWVEHGRDWQARFAALTEE